MISTKVRVLVVALALVVNGLIGVAAARAVTQADASLAPAALFDVPAPLSLPWLVAAYVVVNALVSWLLAALVLRAERPRRAKKKRETNFVRAWLGRWSAARARRASERTRKAG